jgi:hypothetical protein
MPSSTRPLSLVPPLLLLACPGPGVGDDENDDAVTIDAGELDDDDEDSGPGCQSDADCEPSAPLCDVDTGQCFPSCIPGQSETCYDGDEETAQVGICKIGSRACQPDGTWGGCNGQVLPTTEDCTNGLDDDCDGMTDATDADGDGFYSCIEGELADCCDDEINGCVDAHLVNPGAYEVPGNEVDDDCDGMTDEVDPTCDDGLLSSASDPLAYARALDLCATTTLDDPHWGVISGSFTLADRSGQPYAPQRSIRPQFGDNLLPWTGERLAVLSSGHAAAPGQSAPNFAAFEQGTEFNTTVAAPVFTAPCPNKPAGDGQANDSIMLSLEMRVPTNARSFTAKFLFFSAEYPEWVCSQYNDFFVALIESESDENPADGNIAVFDDGEELWPIGVNIIAVAPDEFFAVCESGEVGCQAQYSAVHECTAGPADLVGTGFDELDAGESCNGAPFPAGGGTGWLTMAGNVVPGEIIEIEFAIWDGGGFKFDSLVLLDDWQWSLDAASPGVQIP